MYYSVGVLAPLQVSPMDGENFEGSGCALFMSSRSQGVDKHSTDNNNTSQTQDLISLFTAICLEASISLSPHAHISLSYFPHWVCAFLKPFRTETAQHTPLMIPQDQIQHIISSLHLFVFFPALNSMDKLSPPPLHCLRTLPNSIPPQTSGFLSSAYLCDEVFSPPLPCSTQSSWAFPSIPMALATTTMLGFQHRSSAQITCKSQRYPKCKLDQNCLRICSFPYIHLSWGAESLPILCA